MGVPCRSGRLLRCSHNDRRTRRSHRVSAIHRRTARSDGRGRVRAVQSRRLTYGHGPSRARRVQRPARLHPWRPGRSDHRASRGGAGAEPRVIPPLRHPQRGTNRVLGSPATRRGGGVAGRITRRSPSPRGALLQRDLSQDAEPRTAAQIVSTRESGTSHPTTPRGRRPLNADKRRLRSSPAQRARPQRHRPGRR